MKSTTVRKHEGPSAASAGKEGRNTNCDQDKEKNSGHAARPLCEVPERGVTRSGVV